MEYMCILNAFEKNYFNQTKEIERFSTVAATSKSIQLASSVSSFHQDTSIIDAATECSNAESMSMSSSSTSLAKSRNETIATNSQFTVDSLAHTAALAVSSYTQQKPNSFINFQYYQDKQSQSSESQAYHNSRKNDYVVNSLLWQPWRDLQQAAALHHQLCQQQQQQFEMQQETSRITSKELPTAKWRRDRRQRMAEYQVNDSGTVSNLYECGDSNSNDSPIDMSMTSSQTKYHNQSSPPPSYREPLPGSSYAATRPSVITQAPSKLELSQTTSISNRENENRSKESLSMCENVIDEHFRRSLGADYAVLFGKKSPTELPPPQEEPLSLHRECSSPLTKCTSPKILIEKLPINKEELPRPSAKSINSTPPIIQDDASSIVQKSAPSIELIKAEPGLTESANTPPASPILPDFSASNVLASVDDHFAKALGETWKKLQGNKDSQK